MIDRLRLIARFVTFAAALWIIALVLWGLATAAEHIETPPIAVWTVIGGMIAQLCLWLISKAMRRR